MTEQTIGELCRKQEDDYIRGNTQISKYVPFSQHDTLEKIDAYLNSKHVSGETDSQGRQKPFFNISTAAVNIWYRATDIDRKNIKFTPTNNASVILAFVANIILQNWMVENRLGVVLNEWGRSLARYGSSVLKFVENSKGLSVTVIPWNRLITDSVDFDANAKIEVLELTEAQLRGRIKTNGYDRDAVESLCSTLKSRETLDKMKKDNKNDYIKVYEIHGNLPLSYLTEKESDEDTYVQQMHVISYVGIKSGRKTDYQDFTLFAGEEKKDPYMITHLIKEDGRSLSIGAVEYLFQAQWMVNHSAKSIKDTLDISSRLIFQTADAQFLNRNVLTDFESGDIFIHASNMPLVKIESSKPDIQEWQTFSVQWQNLGQELTATPDSMRGTNPTSGQPYSTTSLLNANANSLFELMTENKGLAIEDFMREFVIPYIKKQLKHKDQVVGILDDAGIQEIDAMYVPNEAVKRFNAQAKDAILNGQIPSPYQPQQAMQAVQQQQAVNGNKRFFVPDDADDKTWAEVFSDFEWNSVRVEVTNEQVDKQAVMNTLNTVFQTIASNPYILQNPNAMQLFSAIMRETGAISPIQLSTSAVLPQALPHTTLRENVDFKDLPPDAQQQMLTKIGIQVQPQQQPAGSSGGLPVNQPKQ